MPDIPERIPDERLAEWERFHLSEAAKSWRNEAKAANENTVFGDECAAQFQEDAEEHEIHAAALRRLRVLERAVGNPEQWVLSSNSPDDGFLLAEAITNAAREIAEEDA